MAFSLVFHRVADVDPWREARDSVTPPQAACGGTAEPVHHTAGDPDNVLVIRHVDSVAAAQGFFAHPDQLDAMQRAGVEAEPRTEFYHRPRALGSRHS